jgi:hypothetical protein
MPLQPQRILLAVDADKLVQVRDSHKPAAKAKTAHPAKAKKAAPAKKPTTRNVTGEKVALKKPRAKATKAAPAKKPTKRNAAKKNAAPKKTSTKKKESNCD